MRSLLSFACIIFACIAVTSCGTNKKEWTTITSGDGGFSILMPPNTVKKDKMEVTSFGKQMIHFISWKPSNFSIDKFKLFEISYTACPDRFITDSIMREVMLDSSISMRKKDFTDKDFPSQAIELNGFPGRAFIFDMPSNNTIAIVKECFVNNRRYDLTVVAKRDQGTNVEIANFFNSFQIIR